MFRGMDSEIRIAMMQAMEERQELGHELLGPDHVLLGLLSNVRGSAYKVFAEHGVTYDWARRVVAEKHDDSTADDDLRTRDDAADTLDEDREALKAIGIDLDKVRAAVHDTFGEDITERWGHRRERRGRARDSRGHRGGRRGPDFGPFGGFDDFGGFGPGGRGRRGPRSRRFDRMTPSLREAMRQIRDEFVHGLQEDMACGRRPDFGAAGPGIDAGRVLAALFNSGDPAIDAIVEAADDPQALRHAVDALTDRTTA